jgi:membrane protease YdiL (CAAX protease family)
LPADRPPPAATKFLSGVVGDGPSPPTDYGPLAKAYVVVVPFIFCAILTGMAVVPQETEAGATGAGLDGWQVLLAIAVGVLGATGLYYTLRRPRGIGPSTYLAPVYVFAGLFGVMGYIVVASGVMQLLRSEFGWTDNVATLTASAAGWIPALVMAMKLERHGRDPQLRWAPAMGFLIWVPVMMVLVPVGFLNLAVLDACGFGTPQQAVMTAFQAAPSTGERIFFIISVCVIAPICEEMVFRGVLYRGMRDMAGMAPAVAGSALLFTAIHLAPTHVLSIFTVGCIMALLYERTGTIVAPIALHIAHNTAALFIAERLSG